MTLHSGSVTLPFLPYARTSTISGKVPARLGAWLSAAPFPVAAPTVAASTSPTFALPPAQAARR